ncbi:hypothetical protein SDC9_20540 [bioreactor metagenome]|jgi:hypothetical protein|uniref:Uncharacterized protein n=1 Tax=bioreactor metagenome TaxID=1076179 RepID=A0A644U766_9ZZZZ|nr:hypothetical protein [Lentimicrobium sp.]MEA5111315.1 hypothetical protein [Lentimicrobium sp.]
MKHSFKLILLILLATPNLFAQKSISDSAIFTHLIHGSLSLQLPGNDLAGRFGQFAQVGPGYMFKTRTNWIFGIESNFIFGGVVKNSENILQSIATSDGNIIDLEGTYADFHFYMRGFNAMARAGKVIPAWGPNRNSGILLTLAGGYLQHKIYIEHRDKTAPQITGDYVKGYDELKNGFVSNIFLGYLYLGNNNKVNFYTGLDFSVAKTTWVRPYSFAERKYHEGSFIDTFAGIRFGWFIPVYRRAPKEFYYY